MSSARQEGVYGPGSYTDTAFVPVPEDCRRLLRELAKRTPSFTKDKELLDGVNFVGHDLPCIPGPIKSVAFTAVLHAMAGIIGHEILELRGISTDKKTTINTDAAGLYLGTPAAVWVDDVSGPTALSKASNMKEISHGCIDSPILMRSQAIYPTKTPGVWYQLHGSSNPWAVLRSIGVDPEQPGLSEDEAYAAIKEQMTQLSARDIEMIQMENGLAGSILWNAKQWLDTRMGATLAKHPLVDYKQVPLLSETPPAIFPALPAGDTRPLAGIKVLELARVIAAPACGALLAAMGAEVIRVQTESLMDLTPVQLTLMAGKAAYNLDITHPEGQQQLEHLFEEADVIIQGYRLRSLERRGFGLDKCLEIARSRGKGIVFLDENCYGSDGYYAERPGWQQVADAAAGSSYIMGKAFGYPDGQGILPSLPISDMSTGVVSAVTILSMLRDRAKFGGSWHGTAALTAYNAATLQPWVGLYPPEIVQKIQETLGFRVWGSDAHVIPLYYDIFETWQRHDYLMDESLYVRFKNSVFAEDLKILAPVVKYSDSKSTPHWTSPPVPFCQYQNPRWK